MTEPGGIPLDLAPLLSPYRQYKNLSLRIERLPDRARLTKGRNNADHTWSLTPDELDDLDYLPPAGLVKAHTIAIRIINLDGEYGATLATLDLPVSPRLAPSRSAAAAAGTSDDATEAIDHAELSRLRDEAAAARAALAQQDKELADTRQKLEQASGEGVKQRIEAELTKARTAWQAEFEKRLAAAASEAAAKLEASRVAWQTEQQERVVKSNNQAQQSFEQARKRWQQEAEIAFAKSKEAWQAAEGARLAALETQWRQKSEHALAEATARSERAESALAQVRAEAETTRGRTNDAELARLRDELASTRTGLAERETALAAARAQIQAAGARSDDADLARLRGELAAARTGLADKESALAQSRSAAEQAGQRAMAEAQTALQKATETWKANEAQRLAAAEVRWREQSSKALAEATGRAERAESALVQARAEGGASSNPGNEAELGRLRDDLAAVQAILSQREIELLEARQRGGPSTAAEMRQAIEADLAAARSSWEVELEQRLEDAAAQASANLKKARADWEGEQQGRATQAQQGSQQDIKSALARATESWKTAEAGRLAEAEAKWRQQSEQALAETEAKWGQQSEKALAEATARFERAEAALAAQRAGATAAQDRTESAEIQRLNGEIEALRGELVAVRTALAASENELAQARAALEQASKDTAAIKAQAVARKAEETRKPEKAQQLQAPPPEEQKEQPKNNIRGSLANALSRQRQALIMRYAIRGGALAASLAVAAFLYPYAKRTVEATPTKIAELSDSVASEIEPLFAREEEPVKPEPPAPASVSAVEARWVIAAPTANVRSGPSPSAGLVATLPRDIEVSPVDRRGSWVLIRFGGEGGNHVREGWVSRSIIKELADQ